MQYDYDNNTLINDSEDLSKLEYEFSKLRKETGLLYGNEYVQDFLERYHYNENDKKISNHSNKYIKKPFNEDISSKEVEAYSYDTETTPHIDSSKRKVKNEFSAKNRTENLDSNGKSKGISIFSRKYGSNENISNKTVSIDKGEAKGDLIVSPSNVIKGARISSKNVYELNKKNYHELDFHGGYSSSDSEKSEVKIERDYKKKQTKERYKKKDEKILYYLDESLDEDSGGTGTDGEHDVEVIEENDESNAEQGLMVSNSFISKIPVVSDLNMINSKFEQNEKEQLVKRIQSLEVIESSQKMLILEAQNREQQHRIRCEELQKQLEYKETKLLLLNQDYESLKKDNSLLNEEKEIIRKKYTEMESHWNQEYSQLYKYKVEYELVSKQNEILMEEKNSFVTMIESDKERYRKMELNHQNLLINLDSLEKRNHEIIERSNKLQEGNDTLSRDYNKLFQKYTSLLSEYGATKKNEEKLNLTIVELQDNNKKLIAENSEMLEKFKFLNLTEKSLENTQEKNIELENEILNIKKERDILVAENKIIEKKIKSNDETIYELKNQILDYTLENQKLKKLIKETLIPILPASEHNSTIGHVLTVLNAKENSRFSVKILEDEYLKNEAKCRDTIKSNVNYSDIIETLKNSETQSIPTRVNKKSNSNEFIGNNKDSPSLYKKGENVILTNNDKYEINNIDDINTNIKQLDSNMKKFNKIAPMDLNGIVAKSCPIICDNTDNKNNVERPYNSVPDLTHDKLDVDNSKDKEEHFEKGINIVTPRPLVKGCSDHIVPTVLPIKLETRIKHSLENEENIPVIPLNDDNADEACNSIKSDGNNNLDVAYSNIKHNDIHEDMDNSPECSHISDCVKMIDNYEKQILLLNVEKVQLESELSVLPRDNWPKSSKEKEERDNIERRLVEIQNSIFKASAGIKKIKEKQKYKDGN